MSLPSGYLHLNVANQWPSFLRTDVEIAPSGALRLASTGGGFAPRGVFRGGPFEVLPEGTPWFRLRVSGSGLPEGTHVQFFTFTASAGDAPFDPSSDTPFSDPRWKAAPRDGFDLLVLNDEAIPPPPDKPFVPPRYLWVGGVLRGGGDASPEIPQMRVEYGRDTYVKFLPAVYGDGRPREFLERFLATLQSVLGGLEEEMADLPLLFDPEAAPAGEAPTWLEWLAGWLAFDIQEFWTDAALRDYLAGAFRLYGKRGTLQGLRRYIKLYAGVDAVIEEPGQHAVFWSLGAVSTLGLTTVLAPAHTQGAVVGTTATLNRSHLGPAGFGSGLFDGLAHKFCVRVYCADLFRPGALDDVRAVIDREKPAHTEYCVSIIKPEMRVGSQARVGVDAIVAAGPPLAQIGAPLDTATLAAHPEPCQQEART